MSKALLALQEELKKQIEEKEHYKQKFIKERDENRRINLIDLKEIHYKQMKEENLKLLKECDKHRRAYDTLEKEVKEVKESASHEKIKWANVVLTENKKLKEENKKLREVKNKRTERMGKIIYDIKQKLEELNFQVSLGDLLERAD